jgi:uncharacterized protein YyaL (SSP411 family)
LTGRVAVGGKPTAYICRNHVCRPPVTTPDDLATELATQT